MDADPEGDYTDITLEDAEELISIGRNQSIGNVHLQWHIVFVFLAFLKPCLAASHCHIVESARCFTNNYRRITEFSEIIFFIV